MAGMPASIIIVKKMSLLYEGEKGPAAFDVIQVNVETVERLQTL